MEVLTFNELPRFQGSKVPSFLNLKGLGNLAPAKVPSFLNLKGLGNLEGLGNLAPT